MAFYLRPVASSEMHTCRLIHLSPTVTLSARMHCLCISGCIGSKGFKVVYFTQFAWIYSEQSKYVGLCGIISEYVTNYGVAIYHPIVMPFSLTVSLLPQCKNFPQQRYEETSRWHHQPLCLCFLTSVFTGRSFQSPLSAPQLVITHWNHNVGLIWGRSWQNVFISTWFCFEICWLLLLAGWLKESHFKERGLEH